MGNRNYEQVKEKLFDLLRDKEEITKEILLNETEKVKKMILINNLNENIIFGEKIEIEEINFEELMKETESYFAITVNSGILLSDKRDRDPYWWSNKEKQIVETYYWDRYEALIKKKLPKEVVKNLDQDTDVIMDNIENPKQDNFDIRGMVVGHVQSGKTGNYSGLLCKAADAGYKFIVVIAGGMNNLRNQTQKRLNEYFVGMEDNQDLEIKRYGKNDDRKQPISLTTSKSDFNKEDANKNSINFDNINSPILIVIKKNVKTLSNVIKWLKSSSKKVITNHAMLLIDDESDYASVNYKEEEDPTQINRKIRELLNLFQKKSYVAYTATPFANIFINYKAENDEIGKDLFPKDFIYSLDAPTNYLGAKKYFLENENNLGPQLIKIDDYKEIFPLVQKKEFTVEKLPESLKEAIRTFIINIAIRRLRGQENQSNSMLVHVTRFTNVHSQISTLVEFYFKIIKNSILSFGKLKNPELQDENIKELKITFEERYKNVEYSFEQILSECMTFIKEIIIREVHQKSKLQIDYKNPINVIAIGGVSLSRGYTLEGLNVSYFIRNSLFYDTLMQMARWFGYRDKYEDLCKLYIPEEIADNFTRIEEAIDELNDTLVEMREQEKTPEDFGLWVKFFPDTQLQVTAKNKSRDTEELQFKINLDGIFKEKAILDMDKEKRENINNNMNLLIENIIAEKGEAEKVNGNYLWRNIDSKLIIEFLDNIIIDDGSIIKEMLGAFPLNFIREYFNETNEKLDVCLYSTRRNDYKICEDFFIGTQERQLERDEKNKVLKVNRRKVATVEPERVILDEKNRKNEKLTGKIIRKEYMKRPLLMLHFLKEKNSNDNIVYGTFGIAFPKKDIDLSKAVSLKVNRVYIDKYISLNGLDDDNYEE